jgi:ATP-dependent 26S proteasome regulatory subunit
LQTLEYFEGTMFLTTNRVESLDDAFESRIHVSLKYPELTAMSRRRVWKNFIQTLQMDTSQITDADLDQFAAVDLNGRQIKNMVKMAGLLAAETDHHLQSSHVEAMMRIAQSERGKG